MLSQVKAVARRVLPAPVRVALRRAVNSIRGEAAVVDEDWKRPLVCEGDHLPPPELQVMVGGRFEAVGKEFLGYLVDLCELKPDDAVLDVGCGSGRIALVLADYLNADATYRGFDISPEAVTWCAEHITTRRPNFGFTVADIFNSTYNPNGKHQAADFTFPYADEAFDCVLAISVFTHMLPRDVDRYVAEIARVARPGSKSLITSFLLNDRSTPLMQAGRSVYNFDERGAGYCTIRDRKPEDAVAYREDELRSRFAAAGMDVVSIHYGGWSGRADHLSFQDLLIVSKR